MIELNNRVLVIDDEQVIRDTFKKILSKKTNPNTEMEAAAADLFNDAPADLHKHENIIEYEVDLAINGEEGFKKVQASIENEQPYAVIFCDMRMPGWDGLTTVQQIRAIDKRCEIVFVTAYSDHSANQISNIAGPNVGYHCKPFESDEIRQIAMKAICDWHRLRDLERLIGITSSINIDANDLDTLLKNILQQLTAITDSSTALLLFHRDSPSIEIGVGQNQQRAHDIVEDLSKISSLDKENQTQEYIYLPMGSYGVLILKDKKNIIIDESRTYLLRLFVQQAAQAIERLNLKKALENEKRLSDLGRAASCIIHDLRQPINVVQGAAQVCQRNLDNQTKLAKMLSAIRQAGLDMNEQLTEILEFSNAKEALKHEETIASLINEIVEEYSITHEQGDTTIEYYENVNFTVSIDRSQIRRVIKNLINNAIEAMAGKTDAPAIQIISECHNNGNTLIISDNGPGIPEPLKESLFEPFVTAGKSSGTGLGLAICKKLVELNGGTIDFCSDPSGTKFNINF